MRSSNLSALGISLAIGMAFTNTALFAATAHVSGKILQVNGQSFTIKAVNYSPTKVGYTPGASGTNCIGPSQWWLDRPAYIADFPLIHRMGANTIRTFDLMNSTITATQVLQVLDAAQANGLYVIMGYSMPNYQNFNPSSASIEAQVLAAVSRYKDHPAVLMWMLGNEVNLTQGVVSSPDPAWSNKTWYNFLNTLAGEIKLIDSQHPIGTAEGEIPGALNFNVGNNGGGLVEADDGKMGNLDVWGMNIYRGRTFDGLFQAYASSTTKPILISEFGKDAWHDAIGSEDQDMQSIYLSFQWQEINANLSATGTGAADLIGGAVFEWSDEWWKDTANDCKTHGVQILFSRSNDLVDANYQDEWLGLTSVAAVNSASNPNGTLRTLRKGYSALQASWNPNGSAIGGNSTPSFFNDSVRNYPNPFVSGTAPTKFVAIVNEAGTIDIRIYDASGQFVTGLTPITVTGAGRYELLWDGKNHQGAYVSSGLYFARIEGHSATHEEKQFRRVVAVK